MLQEMKKLLRRGRRTAVMKRYAGCLPSKCNFFLSEKFSAHFQVPKELFSSHNS